MDVAVVRHCANQYHLPGVRGQKRIDGTATLDGNNGHDGGAGPGGTDGQPPLGGAAPTLPPVDPPVPAAAVPPWHEPIGRAVRKGWLSVEKADSLRTGLGGLDRAITAETFDDTGQTTLDDGILLCRADHLRLHNEHWRITRNRTGQYWLAPPPGLDPDDHPILLTNTRTILRDSD